jgi:hypothetical protein
MDKIFSLPMDEEFQSLSIGQIFGLPKAKLFGSLKQKK